MSERERWIVYPLLFFALGAALRDKLFQRVESREIVCESLKIVDREDPTRLLAKLGSDREITYDASRPAGRAGELTLLGSEGEVLTQIARDLRTSRVITNWMLVIDPANRPRVIAGTEQVPGMSLDGIDSAVTYQGVFSLDNRRISWAPNPQRAVPRPNSQQPNPQQPSPNQPASKTDLENGGTGESGTEASSNGGE
jgi:hypothetical protein